MKEVRSWHYWKGGIVNYCQGLRESLKENVQLITNSFHNELTGDKDFRYYFLERTSNETLCNPAGREFIRNITTNGHLPISDTRLHQWALKTPRGLEATDIRGRQLSQDMNKVCIPTDWYWTQDPFCLTVFTSLLMILVIIRVIPVLWVFVYSSTLWLPNMYKIIVITLFMAYVNLILDDKYKKIELGN